MASYNLYTKEEIKDMTSGLFHPSEIALKYGRNLSATQNWMKKNNVEYKRKKTSVSKLVNNENIFKKLTKELCYVLGFVAADGCIITNKRNKTVEISLAIKDKKHLEKIANILEYRGKIKERIDKKGFKSCRLYLCSTILANDLISLGIVPRKSLKLEWPKIPERFIMDFIRGYFDGDGSCILGKGYNGEYNQLKFQILGTRNVLENILFRFRKDKKTNCGTIYKQENYYVLSVGGTKSSLLFYDWLYNDSKGLFLERKFDIANKFCKKYSKQISKSNRYGKPQNSYVKYKTKIIFN